MRGLGLLLALAVGGVGATAGAQEIDGPTFDWNGSLPAGATLRIADVDGNIRVTGTSSGDARVHGERTHVVSGEYALVFEVQKSGNDVIICARYRSGSCDSEGAHGGIHIGIGHSPSADFTVELPQGIKLAANSGDGSIEVDNAGADVVAKSGDGSIRISGVAGETQAHSGDGDITIEGAQRAVHAHTGDGSIEITTATGPVDATSGDGSIRLHLATDASPGAINLHTGDGSVTMFLGSQFGGQLEASTSDGHIESDFPLALSGRLNPRHIHATLGSGGDARVTVSTGDGDILIKRE